MSAGCSSALLPSRPRKTALQLRCYPSHQETGTQQFNPLCNCSLRYPIAPSASSIASKLATWGGQRREEDVVESRIWERARILKRFREKNSSEDPCFGRAKRTRTGSSDTHLLDSCDETWSPQNIEELPLVEGEVCFIPNAATLPVFTSSTNDFIQSIGMEELGTGQETKSKVHLYSSSSSYDHSSSASAFREPLGIEEFGTDEGSKSKLHLHSSASSDDHNSSTDIDGDQSADFLNTQPENAGLELVSLMISCIESIGFGDYAAINYFLARLGELASPTGTPIHRVTAYFTEALALRAVNIWPRAFMIAPPRELSEQIDYDEAIAFRVLNYVSPIPKFLHFTLNERLLRAFEGKDRVHIIDLDIKQGLQWPGLLQSLASRPNPPSHVRITGIGQSKQDLQQVGDRLAGFADALSLPFKFHTVIDRLEDVRLWMLHVKERECVAVNCVLQLHKLLHDETGKILMEFLELIRSTNPTIVLVAEQEADHNDPTWETRIAYSLKYYSSIFDSLGSCLPEDSLLRIKIEEMFAREIKNIVAYEGSERVERHQDFAKWRQMIKINGFRSMGIGETETVQSRLILQMYDPQNYGTEKQGDCGEGLTLMWSDQPLYTVSAWAPVDLG